VTTGDGRPAPRNAASILALAAILGVFVLLRLPLLSVGAAPRGWNGDASIFGLMAKKIHDGEGFDVFYWGQNYMGPLTSALAAGLRRAFLDPAGFGAEAGPIALRLAILVELAVGSAFFVAGLARLFGQTVALGTGLALALGPPHLIRLAAGERPGPEMAFALGSFLFWLAADALSRPQAVLDRPAGRFVFGLVAGIGWWMNQTIVFVLVPAASVALLRPGPRRIRVVAPLLAGFVLGYAPVWMGRVFGWYEIHLGSPVPPLWLSSLPARLPRFLGADAWRFFGLDGVLPAPLLALAALVFVTLLLSWRPWSGGVVFVAAIAGIGAAVSFLAEIDPAGDRYLTPALPSAIALVLVVAAEAEARLRRRIPAAVSLLVSVGLALFAAYSLSARARATVEGLLSEPDRRGPLRAIGEGGYTVCHAGYDRAYTLQFLSDESVQFIPFHGPDRNRALSARLRAEPGPQCLVTDDGAVRPWLPSDAAQEGGPARRRAEKR
jgi:hypothetical protein